MVQFNSKKFTHNGNRIFNFASSLILLLIPIALLFKSFDFSNSTIITDQNIIYDFSGSWRLHTYKVINGLRPYIDFEYPYPPIGLYLIGFLFSISDQSLYQDSLITAAVAFSIYFIIFLLSKKVITSHALQFFVCFTSFIT